jgi:hypothetical protein
VWQDFGAVSGYVRPDLYRLALELLCAAVITFAVIVTLREIELAFQMDAEGLQEPGIIQRKAECMAQLALSFPVVSCVAHNHCGCRSR